MRRFSLFLVLGLTVSCSAKKTPANPLAEVSGFCAEWAKRACNDKVVAACAATDTDACVQAQQTFCESIVPDGKYSSANAGACLDAVTAAYANATLTATQRDVVRNLGGACALILSGSGGADAVCSDDSDCNRDDGLSCVKKASVTGKCEKPTEVGGGLPCSDPDTVCATGFYCNGQNCIQVSNGTACSLAIPCGPASECLGTDGKLFTGSGGPDGGAASGTCAARKAIGSACSVDEDCTSQICDQAICAGSVILSPSEVLCKDLRG